MTAYDEYQAAIAAHNLAIAAFNGARDAYRARTIGDAEFIAARNGRIIADDAFDVAFEIAATQDFA
jgi:hypothetical protein